MFKRERERENAEKSTMVLKARGLIPCLKSSPSSCFSSSVEGREYFPDQSECPSLHIWSLKSPSGSEKLAFWKTPGAAST